MALGKAGEALVGRTSSSMCPPAQGGTAHAADTHDPLFGTIKRDHLQKLSKKRPRGKGREAFLPLLEEEEEQYGQELGDSLISVHRDISKLSLTELFVTELSPCE